MQKQGNGKSVVHNKPEYADVQMLWWPSLSQATSRVFRIEIETSP